MTTQTAEYRRKWREDNRDKVKLNMEKSIARRRMKNIPNKEYTRQLDAPDLLIGNIAIELTDTQSDYLTLYMDEPRTVLMKMFNKRFNLKINKLQFNQELMDLKEKQVKKTKEPLINKASPCDNVYWVISTQSYVVKFVRNQVKKTLGYWEDAETAIRVANEYRKAHPKSSKRKRK